MSDIQPAAPAELTPEEKAAAAAEGQKQAIVEGAKEKAEVSIGDEPTKADLPERVPPKGPFEVSRFEHLLDLPPEKLKKALEPMTEDKAAGLLECEKSGKNRADVVEALEEVLGWKADDITSAGPRYENVVKRTDHREAEPNPLEGGEYVRPQ